MTPLVVIAAVVAGGVGAVARYGVSRAVASRRFPWAVAIVNVTGSAIAGVVLALAPGPGIQLIMLSGFAGGLTTFSTFAVESVQLTLDRRRWHLLVSVTVNVVGGIAALAAAWAIVQLVV